MIGGEGNGCCAVLVRVLIVHRAFLYIPNDTWRREASLIDLQAEDEGSTCCSCYLSCQGAEVPVWKVKSFVFSSVFQCILFSINFSLFASILSSLLALISPSFVHFSFPLFVYIHFVSLIQCLVLPFLPFALVFPASTPFLSPTFPIYIPSVSTASLSSSPFLSLTCPLHVPSIFLFFLPKLWMRKRMKSTGRGCHV